MKKVLLILLLLPLAAFAGYELAVATIFQNDAAYLKEWIEFHKMQGVQHFYLYNNNSEDNYVEVLNPYLKSGEVTLTDWNLHYNFGEITAWNNIQCAAYMHCIKNYGPSCKWIAFIDTDEFLFCENGALLTNFLKAYKKFAAVGVNWQMFGTSGVWEIPDNGLMIELLNHCAYVNHAKNFHVKSIVQPKYVKGCQNPHFFNYVQGKFAVDVEKRKILGPYTKSVAIDKIRINHYWSRNEKFFYEYKIPRCTAMFGEVPFDVQQLNADYNKNISSSIHRYVPALKQRMGF